MTRTNRDDAGFSLVELVVALSIVAFVLVGMVQAVRGSLTGIGQAGRTAEAATLLADQWATLERDGFTEGQFDGELESGQRWVCNVTPAADTRFYHVELQLFWTEGNSERRVAMESFVPIPPEE